MWDEIARRILAFEITMDHSVVVAISVSAMLLCGTESVPLDRCLNKRLAAFTAL